MTQPPFLPSGGGFPSGPPGSGRGPTALPSPGPIPLRPLTVGEILVQAVQVVRRHLAPLALLSGGFGALSAAALLGVLAGTDQLGVYASATWLQDVVDGRSTTPPLSILLASMVSLLIGAIGTVLVSGVAAACAGADAMGRTDRAAAAGRLAGRWSALGVVAVIVGSAVAVGLVVLIVPGVLAYLALGFAGAVVVMERATPGVALRRSLVVVRGHRGRLLGATAAALLAGVVIDTVVSMLVLSIFGITDGTTSIVVQQGVGVLVGAVTGAWFAAVVALAYIDARVRSEGLGEALRRAATTGS
ncbi:hypothetical protein FDO65_08080 [Nakamurella flava]|uniref:Glycerophosphoryl diester phosphodiesterase membrane domain-containing protein n=1 Tax=Nakamurella flava TaxID=2576308 RepID=A0A4U6QLP9_9ACTN|nr:hypothetical protein [Nakamurella flava]TKV61517.1 hypothetical protein FDO65_08080 [Nakamurella flava]